MNERKEGAMETVCGCPFCDEPACPDPGDQRYSCKSDAKLKVHRVDCVGLYCPVPVMQARDEIEPLEEGSLLEVVADDPASVEDIPRWARRAGHRFLGLQQKGTEYHFLIQKNKSEEE